MSRLFWLTYSRPPGRLCGVVVIDSASLIHGRLRASIEGLDQGAESCEGHELDREAAALVPPSAVGRMLGPDEAAKLIRRIERGIPKRAPAASVRRRSARRRAG